MMTFRKAAKNPFYSYILVVVLVVGDVDFVDNLSIHWKNGKSFCFLFVDNS